MTTDDQPQGTWWEPPARGSGDFRADVRRAVPLFAVGLVGSAVLGLLAGLVWGEVAPRALLQEVGAGEAAIVNAETRAFIGADAWFCGIAVVAGLLTGILGYWFLIARQGGAAGGDHRGAGRGEQGLASRAAAVTGLILGALAGALVMMWIGGQIGLSGYTHALASSHNGTLFNASLTLGAKSALAFWPLLTSVVILVAEWSSRRTAPPQA